MAIGLKEVRVSSSTQFFYENSFIVTVRITTIHKNNVTNDKFYRKIAILMYTEMFNFRPQS